MRLTHGKRATRRPAPFGAAKQKPSMQSLQLHGRIEAAITLAPTFFSLFSIWFNPEERTT
jgi:hypothetical protein